MLNGASPAFAVVTSTLEILARRHNLYRMISAIQCRMARAALDWTVADLSAAAGVGATTIVRFERGQATANRSTVASLKHALEAAGLRFLNGDEPGVSLVLHVALPIEAGEDYLFSCTYKGDNFKLAVNKSFLDEYDLHQDPKQPRGKYLLKRLPGTVGPWVIVAWDKGRRPIAGVIRLDAGDFSAAPPQRLAKRLRVADLPTHDVPWDGSISLRREDMYGGDGR
jgi:transcriptional regulator with XRE-family HTH domain